MVRGKTEFSPQQEDLLFRSKRLFLPIVITRHRDPLANKTSAQSIYFLFQNEGISCPIKWILLIIISRIETHYRLTQAQKILECNCYSCWVLYAIDLGSMLSMLNFKKFILLNKTRIKEKLERFNTPLWQANFICRQIDFQVACPDGPVVFFNRIWS